MTIVSKEAFDNTLLKNRCNNKFSGRISDIARAIIRENLKSPKWQSMNTDETLNDYHAWGEDRTPFEMLLDMQLLAIPNIQTSKGKTARGDTAGYLFWQTATGYQFKSLDKLFDLTDKTVPRYIENSKGDESVPFGYDGKILWSNMSKSVDALQQFETGAWASQVHVFNEVTKTAILAAMAALGIAFKGAQSAWKMYQKYKQKIPKSLEQSNKEINEFIKQNFSPDSPLYKFQKGKSKVQLDGKPMSNDIAMLNTDTRDRETIVIITDSIA